MSRIPTPGPMPANSADRAPSAQARGTPAMSPSVRVEGGAPRSTIKDGDLATSMEYVDFMNELGVLMQLPKRKTTASMATIPDEPVAPAKRRSSVVLPAIAAVMSIGVAANWLLQPVPPREVPVALRGEWVTSQGSYADRRLAFTDGAVGIAVRAGTAPELHPVQSAVTTRRGDTVHVAITYEQDGERVGMSLVLLTQPTRQVQLANPPGIVWHPAVDSTVPRRAVDSASAPTPLAPLSK